MLVAAGGWPGTGLVLATLVGGAAVSGLGARHQHGHRPRHRRGDVDAPRTGRCRPAGSARRRRSRSPRVLLVGGTALLLVVSGWLAAALTVAAWLWYVVVYTLWLKRRSVQNIVIGGAAGAAPPLIGWAAVTGELAAPAWVLFALVTLWTPTHFWALAVGTGQDYARADVPMLPVVRGPRSPPGTGRCTPRDRGDGAAAALVGRRRLAARRRDGRARRLVPARAFTLVRDPSPPHAWRLFHGSNAFLGRLLWSVAVSAFLG
jgi:hypothetical protein